MSSYVLRFYYFYFLYARPKDETLQGVEILVSIVNIALYVRYLHSKSSLLTC